MKEKKKNNINVNKCKEKNPLFYSVDFSNQKKNDIDKRMCDDLLSPGIDDSIERKIIYENIIKFSKRNVNNEHELVDTYSDGKKKKEKSNERLKEELDMIKNYYSEEKLKREEEYKLRNEIQQKRKLYELKIRKDFEEKIRLRREENEKRLNEEKINKIQQDNGKKELPNGIPDGKPNDMSSEENEKKHITYNNEKKNYDNIEKKL